MKSCESCRFGEPGKYGMWWCARFRTFKETAVPCVDWRKQG